MAGKITLSESNNETRIEWKINHFFIREDNLIISPDFTLFHSKWFLQLHLGGILSFSDSDTNNNYCEPLRMSLLTLNPATQYHIGYRMGIQACNGSEITTKNFESLLNKGFGQTPQRRKVISRKDFESSRNNLVSENTLTVFCSVRLISAVNPDKDVLSPIPSTDGDLSSSLLLFCNEIKSTGEITLDESKNETRIEWRINDFSNTGYYTDSPGFVLFNSKWIMRIQELKNFMASLYEPDTVAGSSLSMLLERPYPYHKLDIEYGTGIQLSNGSEIRTKTYRSMFGNFVELVIISRKDFKSASDILDSENTLKVFCTMRLLSEDNSPGGISLLDNLSFFRSGSSDGTIVGKISLDKGKNKTRIEWTINHFCARKDIFIKCPDFILFKSNWFLQITKIDNKFLPANLNHNISGKSLRMYLQRDCYSTAEHHIEYRMGIQRPDGSETITETFESVFQPRFKKSITGRELVSEEDLERLGHTLTRKHTLKVFCTVRLLNDDNPPENVTSPISSTHGTEVSYENTKSISLTKDIFTLNENAKDVHLTKENSTLNTNNESSGLPKGIFNFGGAFKDSGAWHENSKSRSLTESKSTLSGIYEWESVNSVVPWLPKFGFNFGEQFKGTATPSESSKCVCPSKGIHTLSENLEGLYQSKRLADVTVKVKDKEFHAHKTILSTRSEVFASMFEHDTSEKRSSVVDITDCDPHSFENFLLYLYTGKLDTVLSSNATSLFKTADKYGVEELKEECVRCMSREMTVNSFCDVFHLAALHGEIDLLSNATNFFVRNASAILVTKEWLTLLDEHSSLCNELLVKFAKNSSKLSSRHNRLTSRKPGHKRVSAKPNKNTF